MIFNACRLRIQKGDCFAKAYISTAPSPPRQNSRLPRTHEDKRRPQGSCCTPQKRPPSAYPGIERGLRWHLKVQSLLEMTFRAKHGLFAGENLTLFIEPESGAQVPTLLFSFVPISCLAAGSDSASKRPSAARWYAIESGAACEKSFAATGWRYPQDGT